MKILLTFILTILISLQLLSQEVVQWRGENRDGIYEETNLLNEWPEDGPELLWKFDDLGEGHASAAVTTDFIYTAGTSGNNGFVICFDHTEKIIWKSEYGKEWMDSWPGVRTTPLVIGDKLYLMSGFGKLFCMNTDDGSIAWSIVLLKDLDGRNIVWGVTENLEYDGDMLFCTPGGIEANVIAVNRNSGEIIWKSQGNEEMSAYNSPLLINHNGRKILVTMTANSILGIDASNGNMLWKYGQTNQYSVHANTPLYKDGLLYCVSGYGKGGVMLKIADDGNSVKKVWKNSSQDNRMGGVVLVDGKIYGSGDYNRNWYCLDWETGKELYSAAMVGKGNIIYADGMLYCYGESGNIGLVKPEADKFKLVSQFRVPFGSAQHWAHLVIHNKKLYVRHGNSLMVFNISQ